MNIRYLQELLSRTEEITVIGKNAKVDGVLYHVMGIVRYGMKMKLLILQYDEAFQNHICEDEVSYLYDNSHRTESNRMVMHGNHKTNMANPFQAVSKVFINDREFDVHASQHHGLSVQDLEIILIFSKFLNYGWQPQGIDFQSIDRLCLTSLDLEGDYSEIPNFGENLAMRFTMGPNCMSYLVEQPITLTVGDNYTDKLRFRNSVIGEEHWAQINRVYLADMWADRAKVFDNPKIREQMTPDQIAEAKSDFEEKFLEICPKGMYFPVIEYECEESISLQFYSKAYLDAKPAHVGVMGFMVRPDQPTGILGLKLKSTIIQEPVLAETLEIEAELFQYNHIINGEDIVFK